MLSKSICRSLHSSGLHNPRQLPYPPRSCRALGSEYAVHQPEDRNMRARPDCSGADNSCATCLLLVKPFIPVRAIKNRCDRLRMESVAAGHSQLERPLHDLLAVAAGWRYPLPKGIVTVQNVNDKRKRAFLSRVGKEFSLGRIVNGHIDLTASPRNKRSHPGDRNLFLRKIGCFFLGPVTAANCPAGPMRSDLNTRLRHIICFANRQRFMLAEQMGS
jgi:hypothetical protein